jgi:hypothetical protein
MDEPSFIDCHHTWLKSVDVEKLLQDTNATTKLFTAFVHTIKYHIKILRAELEAKLLEEKLKTLDIHTRGVHIPAPSITLPPLSSCALRKSNKIVIDADSNDEKVFEDHVSVK